MPNPSKGSFFLFNLPCFPPPPSLSGLWSPLRGPALSLPPQAPLAPSAEGAVLPGGPGAGRAGSGVPRPPRLRRGGRPSASSAARLPPQRGGPHPSSSLCPLFTGRGGSRRSPDVVEERVSAPRPALTPSSPALFPTPPPPLRLRASTRGPPAAEGGGAPGRGGGPRRSRRETPHGRPRRAGRRRGVRARAARRRLRHTLAVDDVGALLSALAALLGPSSAPRAASLCVRGGRRGGRGPPLPRHAPLPSFPLRPPARVRGRGRRPGGGLTPLAPTLSRSRCRRRRLSPRNNGGMGRGTWGDPKPARWWGGRAGCGGRSTAGPKERAPTGTGSRGRGSGGRGVSEPLEAPEGVPVPRLWLRGSGGPAVWASVAAPLEPAH